MDDRTKIRIGATEITLPFRYEHGLVLFDGEGPKGESLTIELDTCTSPNAVRHDLVIEKGWPTGDKVESVGITGESETVSLEAEVPELRIGNMVITSLLALTDPLGGPAAPDIMLGERFLREVIVRIDFKNKEVRFHRYADWKPPVASGSLAILALDTGVEGVPCLRNDVTINGEIRAGTALLDTGFNGAILLSPEIAEEAGIRAGAPGVRSATGGGYGGPADVLIGKVREIQIGPFFLKDVVAVRPPEGSGAMFDDERWVNLGNGLFQEFKVTWALPLGLFVMES